MLKGILRKPWGSDSQPRVPSAKTADILAHQHLGLWERGQTLKPLLPSHLLDPGKQECFHRPLPAPPKPVPGNSAAKAVLFLLRPSRLLAILLLPTGRRLDHEVIPLLAPALLLILASAAQGQPTRRPRPRPEAPAQTQTQAHT